MLAWRGAMPRAGDSGDGLVFDFTTECGFISLQTGNRFLAAKLNRALLIRLSGVDVDDADAALEQFGHGFETRARFPNSSLG
jgi:hypothetical protein